MNSRFGPIRLIALHCGKFDYAEIELDRPLHLVGPNNVGKTSLIALLQFLYLDEQNSMRFSRDLPETRKYYFPGVHSYALFECLTPTGYQTVGVRGCGPVKQYNIERFSYMGRFDEKVFMDDQRRVRGFDEIRAALASKAYTPLASGVLRAALTGVGDSHKVTLGLVPAKNRDTYKCFKDLFCNILRLSHIRQDEMKKLILSLFEKNFHQPKIDLAKTYQENFEKVKRDTRSVQMLKELVPDIERALLHRDKRDAARSRLPGLYNGVNVAAQAALNQIQYERAAVSSREKAIQTELQQSDDETDEKQNAIIVCTETLTRLNDWLTETEKLEASLADYISDWASRRLIEIDRLSNDLARRLGNLNDEPIADVEARLEQRRKELSALQKRLTNLEHSVIQALRERFSDHDLINAFRLINPVIMGLPVDTSEAAVSIKDAEAAVTAIKAMLHNCADNRFDGCGVEIALESLAAPELGRYGDPKQINADIERIKRQVKRDEQLCKDAQEAETLRNQKQLLEQERLDLHRKQERYKQLLERREQMDAITLRRQQTLEQEEQLKARINELKVVVRNLTVEQQSLHRELDQINQKELNIQDLLDGIVQPPDEWAEQPVQAVDGDLEDLAARYKKDQLEQQRQDEALLEVLSSIEERTYSRYAGADEGESLQKLKEARDALPEQEKAAAELWKSIAVGIRENLQNMGSDLDTLRTRINSINRSLFSINISNLKSIKLAIVEIKQWTKRIKSIRLQDEMPLFINQSAVDEAFSEIARLLTEKPTIELGDLFQLEFEVTMPDDSVRRYPHLDRIESNGTTIAIKVLVNLALLKYLLQDAEVVIPFYLDECSSLDSDNLNAIVMTASEMGFNAILASPEAMDAAARIYFIREQENGRVVLDPRSALVECLGSDYKEADGEKDE